MKQNIKRTLDVMVHAGVIPNSGKFDISEDQIDRYIEYYSEINGKGNKKYNYKFARKLAGLNLLKFKVQNGENYKSCKEGLIYFIENPAFGDYQKVGMTVDLVQRLRSYQTYDPLKRFTVSHYDFVLNRRHTEEKILNSFNVDIESGEWIKKTDALKLIDMFK